MIEEHQNKKAEGEQTGVAEGADAPGAHKHPNYENCDKDGKKNSRERLEQVVRM